MSQLISKHEIKQIFLNKIKPRMSKIEHQRNKVQTNLLMFGSTLVLITGLSFFFIQGHGVWIIFFISCMSFGFFYRFIIKNYTHTFKHQVIKEVFEALVHNCHYGPTSKISRTLFDQSKILNTSYHEYSGEDFVKGQIAGYEVEFSEVKVVKKTKNRRGLLNRITVYQGVFFYFKLPKSLDQNTLILPDLAEKRLGKNLGRFFQKQTRKGYDLVQLECIEFEKQYVVFSDDQVKARKILAPLVMENLIRFKKKHRAQIDLSLRQNKLYVGIRSRHNMFEPKIFGEVVDFADIREIYDLISLVRDLQETLRLDKAV